MCVEQLPIFELAHDLCSSPGEKSRGAILSSLKIELKLGGNRQCYGHVPFRLGWRVIVRENGYGCGPFRLGWWVIVWGEIVVGVARLDPGDQAVVQGSGGLEGCVEVVTMTSAGSR